MSITKSHGPKDVRATEMPLYFVSTGSSWAGYRHCRRAHHKPACIPEIRRSCLKSKIRVTKVLRLQLDAVEPLLEDDKSLKVVQVFRDPRGIMCSRTVKTWWYALRINNGYSPIKVNARLLCNKMLKDFKAGKELMKRFPNRVKFIRYEDLVCRNRKTVVKELYEFLKLERRSNKIQVTTSGFKWKQLLDKEDIEKIDDVCSDVYNALGFHKLSEQKNFENEYSSFISDFDINK